MSLIREHQKLQAEIEINIAREAEASQVIKSEETTLMKDFHIY